MITGYIRSDRPHIPIAIGQGQNVQEIVALVDTGFTGELKLSPELAKDLGITTKEVQDVMVGNGENAPHGVGRAYVSMDGIKREVSVFVGNGPTVIGIKLLRNFGFKLTVLPTENIFYLEGLDEDPFNTEE